MLFCTLVVILLFVLELALVTSKVEIMQDSLDFSNLAVYKNISQKELGDTGNIKFEETDLTTAYATFKEYIEKNFDLDTSLSPKGADSYIYGQVVITDLRIYNVVNNLITEYKYDSTSGTFIKLLDNVSYAVNSPDGHKIEKTSIYSAIDVNVKMLFKYDDENYTRKIEIARYTDAVN